MKLRQIHIYRIGENLQGTLTFDNSSGEIQIKIKEEHLSGILGIVAEGLVASAREVAEELTVNVIEAAAGLVRPMGELIGENLSDKDLEATGNET